MSLSVQKEVADDAARVAREGRVARHERKLLLDGSHVAQGVVFVMGDLTDEVGHCGTHETQARGRRVESMRTSVRGRRLRAGRRSGRGGGRGGASVLPKWSASSAMLREPSPSLSMERHAGSKSWLGNWRLKTTRNSALVTW